MKRRARGLERTGSPAPSTRWRGSCRTSWCRRTGATALRVAVAAAGGEYIDPREHVAALEAEGTEVGRGRGAHHRRGTHHRRAAHPPGPATGRRPPAVERLVQFGDALCTVVTRPGLTLPQTSDPSLWSDDDAAAAPIRRRRRRPARGCGRTATRAGGSRTKRHRDKEV